MTFSKVVEKLEARGQKFEGFFCLMCFFKNKNTVIFNYRRNHLIKVHGYNGKSLANEMDLEEKNSIDAGRFLILLGGNQLVCPHCPEIMQKYTSVDDSDFIIYNCINKKCSYMQRHKHYYQTEELFEGIIKKKFFCASHRWNNDTEKCRSCMWAMDFNKNVAPKLNKIFNKIMKQ